MVTLTSVVYNLASEPMALVKLKREPDAFMNRCGLSVEQAKIVTANNFHLLGQAISDELDDAEGNSSFLVRLGTGDDEEEDRP